MDGYSGPEDLEFWMNTLGVEYMNWEVLHEVDRLGLQLPSGWKCVAREFEEWRMESNYPAQHLAIGANRPDYSYTKNYNSNAFRSERHGGTFAVPAAAMIIPNQASPQTTPAALKPTLPGTQTTFSWGRSRQPQVPTPVPVVMAPTAVTQIQIHPANTYRFGA